MKIFQSLTLLVGALLLMTISAAAQTGQGQRQIRGQQPAQPAQEKKKADKKKKEDKGGG